MRVLRGAALSVHLACTPALAKVEAPACPSSYVAAGELPGPAIYTPYSVLKPMIPKSAHCGRISEDGCAFLDRWGYRDMLTAWLEGGEKSEPVIFARWAIRAHHARLPYGATWSDRRAEVTRKLKALKIESRLGDDADGPYVFVLGCFRNQNQDGFSTTFMFDAQGRLAQVRRSTDYRD